MLRTAWRRREEEACFQRFFRCIIGLGALFSTAIGTCPSHAQASPPPVNVTTYHYDSGRTGWNQAETVLTTSNVNSQSFGLLHSVPLDDQVDAQPLVVTGLVVNGTSREVVYVVTESDSVYAIDATTGSVLAQRQLGNPVPMAVINCDNNGSNVGITSTPVIDPASSTLYLLAYTLENNQPAYRVHALDLVTLADKVAPPVVSASGNLADGTKYEFTALFSRQRAGLVLAQENIYAGFGSFCDHKRGLTRGWMLGWKADSLAPIGPGTSANRGFLTDLRTKTHSAGNFFLTSIWMSGYGVAADDSGNLFFTTGNSDFKAPYAVDPTTNLQESVVKLRGDLTGVLDYFTPSGPQFGLQVLEQQDNDFGSGGILLVPGEHPGPVKHLAVAVGKIGQMYLLDRENLGKYDPGGTNHVLDAVGIGACWCGPSYFVGPDGLGRAVSSGDLGLIVWKIELSGTPPSLKLVKEYSSNNPGAVGFQKGFFTSVSSNGQAAGSAIIWALLRPTAMPPNLTLYAFDAKDGTVLYQAPAGSWPNTGGAANTVPVVANGRVYVASYKELRIFGPGGRTVASVPALAAAAAPQPRETVHGTIANVTGSYLWLRTRTGVMRIDVTTAEQEQLTVPLVPGKAVAVHGLVDEKGVMNASRIDYAAESPALWSPDH